MRAAFAHALGLLLAAGAARYGWFMAHHPERALRLFTFGTAPMFGKQFFIVWNRGVGWFFTAFGCFGAGVYLVMIAIDLFRAL